MDNFVAHSQKDREEMLNSIGISSVEDLFVQIPKFVRIDKLNLPKSMSEMEVQREIKKIVKKRSAKMFWQYRKTFWNKCKNFYCD